tara:strand:- start:8 stop:622 length:615 start_codon:yes stop_codon:yes gene_type:complete
MGDKMFKKFTIAALIALFVSFGINAEEPKGSHASSEWQIWAYTTSAPSFIGNFATVIGGDGSVIREGTNGWRCEAFMPMPDGGFKVPHDAAPACSDKNAVAWAIAYKAGTIPEMEGDGWVWMNHGDLGVDNFTLGTDGQKDAGHAHYIESGPHLMLMPKDPSSLEGQSTDFTTGAPYVMFKGTPYAHLMIPLVDYYSYQPESSP